MDPDLLAFLPGAPFTDEEVAAAVAVVQAAVGWHIAPEQQETVTVSVGYSEQLLRLPTRKLVSVEEIRDADLDTTIDDATYRVLTTVNQVLKTTGYWPPGYERVEVDMTHGYEAWPLDLLPVIAEVASTNRRDQTVRAQSAGVFTVAYGSTQTGAVGTSAALDRYLLNQPGMA